MSSVYSPGLGLAGEAGGDGGAAGPGVAKILVNSPPVTGASGAAGAGSAEAGAKGKGGASGRAGVWKIRVNSPGCEGVSPPELGGFGGDCGDWNNRVNSPPLSAAGLACIFGGSGIEVEGSGD